MSWKINHSFGLIFRAFKYRNFRLYFTGQGISQIGSWAQSTALSWLVYRLTGSTIFLGLIGFANQIPTFLIGPFAGVIIDRLPRYKVLLVTQFFGMIQAFILGYLVFSGNVSIHYLFILAVFQGIITAFDMPARQTFVVELVEKKDEKGNAIALNSMMFNLARILGPSAAGFIIAGFGEGVCFLLNGLSFLAVIATLMLMKFKISETVHEPSSFWTRLKEGIRFAGTFAPIRTVLILVAFNSFACFSYSILLSAFVKEVLNGEAHTLGLLMGCTGVGALLGGTALGMRQGIKGMGMFMFYCALIFGVGLIGLSFSENIYTAIIFLLMTGFGMIGQMASCNTILQTLSGNKMRGRVMSLYTTAYIGMMPFGSIASGALA
ncbi:MAG: MFS transporter, partial [Opitutaceae bacterium]|nr:MFS transporter [Cytophagales bacterium]